MIITSFKNLYNIFILFISSLGVFAPSPLAEKTIFGDYMIQHPVLKTFIQAPIMQRIKEVDQSGPLLYFGYAPAYSRFEHCVGVWALVHKAGGSLKEQAAALLHDASHGPFSHVLDHVMRMPEQDHSYQDKIHLWFLENMGVTQLIQDLDAWTLADLDPDQATYVRLEQPLPELCADRIEYILHTGLLWGKISQQELDAIISDLHFTDNCWYLTSVASARKLGELSLYFTEHLWGAPWNLVLYTYFAEILRHALSIGLITEDDLHFGTDKKLLAILESSTSPYIIQRLSWCRSIHNSFKIVTDDTYDILLNPKFRGVNPWVKTESGLKRLCDIDQDYAHAFTHLKSCLSQGIKIILFKDHSDFC